MPSHQESVDALTEKLLGNPLLPDAEKNRLRAILPVLTGEELSAVQTVLSEGTDEAMGTMVRNALVQAGNAGDTETPKRFDEFFRSSVRTLRQTDEEIQQAAEASEAEQLLDASL